MTLLTMSVPDDPADLPRWLERRLAAPDFGRFAAELAAHFPAAPAARPACRLLDQWAAVALESGLGAVPADVLTEALRRPADLAAFQQRVATEGGAYWDDVFDRTDDLAGAVERGKRSLDRIVTADTPPPAPRAVPSEVAKRAGGRGYKVWAFASTGVAACLAVAVAFLLVGQLRGPDEPPVPKAQIAWGWGKPSGLALDESSPRKYLDQLAANAEEWSLHRPSDPSGVGTRIAEFRAGCTRLMHSAYGPLSPADKGWLLDHCRAWAKRLDAHQQALDAGADPLAVRAEVDATVREIAATLRDKAKQVG